MKDDFYHADDIVLHAASKDFPTPRKHTRNKKTNNLSLEIDSSVDAATVPTDELSITSDNNDVVKVLKLVSSEFSETPHFTQKPIKTYANRRKTFETYEYDFPKYPEELECTFNNSNSDSEDGSFSPKAERPNRSPRKSRTTEKSPIRKKKTDKSDESDVKNSPKTKRQPLRIKETKRTTEKSPTQRKRGRKTGLSVKNKLSDSSKMESTPSPPENSDKTTENTDNLPKIKSPKKTRIKILENKIICNARIPNSVNNGDNNKPLISHLLNNTTEHVGEIVSQTETGNLMEDNSSFSKISDSQLDITEEICTTEEVLSSDIIINTDKSEDILDKLENPETCGVSKTELISIMENPPLLTCELSDMPKLIMEDDGSPPKLEMEEYLNTENSSEGSEKLDDLHLEVSDEELDDILLEKLPNETTESVEIQNIIETETTEDVEVQNIIEKLPNESTEDAEVENIIEKLPNETTEDVEVQNIIEKSPLKAMMDYDSDASDSSIESPMFEKHISVESPIFIRETKHSLAQKIIDFQMDISEKDLAMFENPKGHVNSPITLKDLRTEIQKLMSDQKNTEAEKHSGSADFNFAKPKALTKFKSEIAKSPEAKTGLEDQEPLPTDKVAVCASETNEKLIPEIDTDVIEPESDDFIGFDDALVVSDKLDKKRDSSSSPEEFDHLPLYIPPKKNILRDKKPESVTATENIISNASNNNMLKGIDSDTDIVSKERSPEVAKLKIPERTSVRPRRMKLRDSDSKTVKYRSSPKAQDLHKKVLLQNEEAKFETVTKISDNVLTDSPDKNVVIERISLKKKKHMISLSLSAVKPEKHTETSVKKFTPKKLSNKRKTLKKQPDTEAEIPVPSEAQILHDVKVGSVMWGRVGGFPYWPCIIACEPGTEFHTRMTVGLRQKLLYHVHFFGDNGRRSWINVTHMFPFKTKNDLEEKLERLKATKALVRQSVSLFLLVLLSRIGKY